VTSWLELVADAQRNRAMVAVSMVGVKHSL
jgi:hypothetical protein